MIASKSPRTAYSVALKTLKAGGGFVALKGFVDQGGS